MSLYYISTHLFWAAVRHFNSHLIKPRRAKTSAWLSLKMHPSVSSRHFPAHLVPVAVDITVITGGVSPSMFLLLFLVATIDASTVNSIAASASNFGLPFWGQRLNEFITVEATVSAKQCVVIGGTSASCVALTAFYGIKSHWRSIFSLHPPNC